MKKITFQGVECYIAYKVLKHDLTNFQKNYTYELNSWYSALDVDENTSDDCSYGCNLSKTISWCLEFMKGRIFKCYVPIDDNKVTFVGHEDKFRCMGFYLTSEEIDCTHEEFLEEIGDVLNLNLKFNPYFDYKEYDLKVYQINILCIYRNDFDYKNYNLKERQIDLLCEFRNDFDYKAYDLTEHQINILCKCRNDFDYKAYDLTEYKIDLLCRFRKDFDYKNYDLTKYQIDILCKCRNDFDYKNYNLNEHQINTLCEWRNDFDYKAYDLTEHQINLLTECNPNYEDYKPSYSFLLRNTIIKNRKFK